MAIEHHESDGSSRQDAPVLLRDTVVVRTGDTLARILTSRGHDAATVSRLVAAAPSQNALSSIRAGKTIEITTDGLGVLHEISYAQDPLRTLSIRRTETGEFAGEVIEKQAFSITRYAEGVIDDSLFASGKRAGVSDGVILKMADVFGYDIDFALEVRSGDTFRVLYEEVLVDGQKIRDGNVLSAEFVNQGKTYQAVHYTGADGRSSYYTPDGMALRKAFLRSPVDFARISSRFNPNRRHPILHTIRAHKGVDYAAPRGTPVRATANGRVEYAGNKGGYGKTIVLQHANRYSTLYAHLDRIAATVRNGSRVTQGQIIGYIGSTGLSSGPHLHYEFRVGGVHVDPLKAKPAPAEPIAAVDRPAFLAEAGRLLAMMNNLGGRTAVAQASSEPAATRL
ncbi:MAG: peptidoglycan DD-metalloendopeptidase family protein [Gammaproteobacteria bacterium]